MDEYLIKTRLDSLYAIGYLALEVIGINVGKNQKQTYVI
jgi:hypothetical protein